MGRSPEARAALQAWLEDLNSEVDHSALEARFWALAHRAEWEVGHPDLSWASQEHLPCMRWKGSHDSRGYGIFTIKDIPIGAHRVAVRLGLHTPGAMHPRVRLSSQVQGLVCIPRAVPPDQVVDHARDRGCIHKDCVLPAHLDVVRSSANSGRKRRLDVFT